MNFFHTKFRSTIIVQHHGFHTLFRLPHIFTAGLFFLLTPKANWFYGQTAGHEVGIVASNLLLIQAWIPRASYFFSLNGVSWSLSTEAFFYLVFPFLRYRWASTWHWKTLLIMIAVGLLLTITTAHEVPGFNYSDPMAVSSLGYAYISPFSRINEFLLGMIAASAYGWVSRKRLFGSIVAWTAIEIIALSLIPLMDLLSDFPSKIVGRTIGNSSWGVFAAHDIAGPAFVVVVVVFAIGRGAFSKVLSTKPMIALGEASFALYLIHQLLNLWFSAHRSYFDFMPDAVRCLLYWAVCIASSFALWALIEKPCRSRIRAWLYKSSASSQAAASA